MEVTLSHTREKYWGWYNVYLLPTIRVCKEKPIKNVEAPIIYRLDFVWLTIYLSFKWIKK